MLVLLPPSEGKTAPATGRPLDLDSLSLPELTDARRAVLDALVDLCRGEPEPARTTLGLSPGLASEITRNAALPSAPTARAGRIYSGVLYDAMDLAGADRPSRTRLTAWVRIWSGLFGVVRLDDAIPAYRLPGAVTLPGVGRIPSYWRGHLDAALEAEADRAGVILDLRSGTYTSSWSPPADRTLVGRVVHEHDGRRTVASHFNKATKGRLVRALADSGRAPRTPEALVDRIRDLGYRVEVEPHGRRPRVLDIIVDHL